MTMQLKDQNMEKVPDKYQLRISDLPGEIRAIAELIGLKATLKIASEYSGETIYIPKHDSITRAVRDRAIREEYTGANHKELAKKFNLTTRIIRKIIDEK